MVNFALVAMNAVVSAIFIFCALILASQRDVKQRTRNLCIAASFLIAALGVLKFLLRSYPITAFLFVPGLVVTLNSIFCFITCLILYLIIREAESNYRVPLIVLASSIIVELILAFKPNGYLLVLQCVLIAASGFLFIKLFCGSVNVTRTYLEGIFTFGVIFALAIVLVVHLEAGQNRSVISRAFESVRTYQQIIADTEKRMLSDAKLLALGLLNVDKTNGIRNRRLFVWKKAIGAHSISYLNDKGVVISSTHSQLVHKDISYIKAINSTLKGSCSSAIRKCPIDSTPVLMVSRPVFSGNFSVCGAIVVETALKDTVGDNFKRNGLFFMDLKNEVVSNAKNIPEPLAVPFSADSKTNINTNNLTNNLNTPSFCIYDRQNRTGRQLCYDESLFKLVALPLYNHDVTIAKIFSMNEVLLNRFELALAIFLSATIYLLLLHKFIKNRFYSVRLQKEMEHRKKAEKRLKTLAAVVEQAVESIIITDPSGIIKYVNPFFSKTTGLRPEEVIGTKADFAKEDETNTHAFKEIWTALLEGRAWSGRLATKAKTGKNLIEDCIIFPIKGKHNEITGIVAIKKDVTREKELESLLLHAQKMESIGMLAGGIAHDFNNILAALQINLDLIPLFNYDPEKTRNYLEKIQYGVSRATDLVKQLLIFSRRKLLDREVVDINQSISNLMGMIESTLGENIRLYLEKDSGLWPIVADPGVVDQTIMNLVVNAKDAMPKGGKLYLKTSNVVLDKPGLRKKFVRLSVKDTGHGMKKEILEQIFDPFFTTKEIGKGTGLGLSVVYGIVKQHGGFIDVNSREGEGTTFDVYFPATPEACAEAEGQQERTAAASKGRGQNILLVEDEEAVRKVIREVLLENGYRVTCCKSVQEAEEALRAKRDFELLLSDVVLPDGSGVDLANEIRKTRPNVSILLMSGYVDKRTKEEEIKKQGYAYFRKPFKISQLLSAIADALKQEGPSGK